MTIRDLLLPFNLYERARLDQYRARYARGLACEFDRVDSDEPWACRRDAAYVGPPSAPAPDRERRP